jgi:hypothetical protein
VTYAVVITEDSQHCFGVLNFAYPSALAADGDLPLPQIDVTAPRVIGVVQDASQLGQPDAGGPEHRDNRGVAALGEAAARARLLQPR